MAEIYFCVRECLRRPHQSRCVLCCIFFFFQPKSSVVGLLNEMIAKFEEDPPLSSKTTVDSKDPHELLSFVSNLRINDGA